MQPKVGGSWGFIQRCSVGFIEQQPAACAGVVYELAGMRINTSMC